MKIITQLKEWQKIRSTLSEKASLGFVPTMGCLHEGHASLIQQAKQGNDLTVISLYVNPMQFNDAQDFQRYPKTPDNDLSLAQKLGIDYVLMPSHSEMYPDEQHYQMITRDPFAEKLEGKYRPKHFHGVLTIVMKLLSLVRPTHAYFGEKDYQQWYLIEKMARAFLMTTQIIRSPIFRDERGLALSSRLNRLSPEGIRIAQNVAQLFLNDPERIRQEKNIKLEYLETHNNRLFLAYYVEGIRLIDNRLI